MRLEGKGSSRLLQLLREAGKNFEVSIELATVISPPPDLKIELDKTGIELKKEDLIVAECLTNHKRKVTIKNNDKTKLSKSDNTNISTSYPNSTGGFSEPEEEPVESYTFDSFNLENASFSINDAEFKTEEAEIEFLDELEGGNRVIVAGINDFQTYIILDRAVIM